MVEAEHGEDGAATRRGAECFLPAVGGGKAGDAMIGEQAGQALARAGRIAGDHHLLLGAAQGVDMLADRLIDIGVLRAFRREIARAVDGEVEDGGAFGFMEGGGGVHRPAGGGGVPLGGVEIERVRRERAIGAGIGRFRGDAVGMIVTDRLEPGVGRADHAMVADDDRVIAQMFGQRNQLFLEQRQPMFHAGQAPAFAHRLIERIAGRGRAEGFAIAAAEALDRVFVEQRLGRGEQGEAVDAASGALVGRVEAAHRLDLVAEEVEAQRLFLAAGKQVDDAAANGEFAAIMNGVGADIAVGLQHVGEARDRDPLLGGEARDQLADAERGKGALGQGVEGGEDQLRPFWFCLERMETGEAGRRGAERGAGPVIGQAVPGGDFDDLDLWREIMGGVGDRAHQLLVRSDEDGTCRRSAGDVRQQPGLEAGRHAGQGERRLRLQDFLEIGHGSIIFKNPPL
jgi:hypothetical protein